MPLFYPIPRRLLSFETLRLPSAIPPRLLFSSASAAAADFWRLLRSNNELPSFERTLSRSLPKIHLTASVVESVLATSSDDVDRALALRFFVWAGLQPRHIHSAAAYAFACDALHLSRHPQFLSHLLDYYRVAALPVSLKTFKILFNLCRHGDLPDEALALLRKMPEFDCRPNTSSYNAVIRLLADAGRGPAVAALLADMAEANSIPDMITYVSAVRGLSASGQIGAARRLLGQMRTNGCVPNVVVYSAFLDGACACGDLKSAMEVLGEMENGLEGTCAPNVVSYTCLMKCLCEQGRLYDALGILDRMARRGCSPNPVTVRTLIDGFCARGYVEIAHELIQKVAGDGKVSAQDCYNVFVRCLLRIEDVDEAQKVLQRMLEKGIRPNGSAFNSLMRALCERRQFLDAYNWLLDMEERGLVCVNSDVYSSLLLGICDEGHTVEALKLGTKIVEREIPLQGDCADGIIGVLKEFGEHALASQIMRLKQPHNSYNIES
ncbi:pentatricopeptide repeat-containing protein [Canna indica]|uniref:Pentatricopeptide repeat-containing protein n=1 Tax=Canna indica TaxID=4628 RepID=A0AAQ3QHQ1_9LILI|nr:pentatricopeptide repeat-containing protein [Canna indica]